MNDIWKSLPREILLYMLEWNESIKNRNGRLMNQISKQDPRKFLYKPKDIFWIVNDPENYILVFNLGDDFFVSIYLKTPYYKETTVINIYKHSNLNHNYRYMMK